MNALNRLAVWLIFATVTTHGGDGLSLSGTAPIGSDPVLVGIINLPGFERCLVNVSNSSKSAIRSFCEMAKGEQYEKVQVVKINPAEGRVEFMLWPEKRSLGAKGRASKLISGGNDARSSATAEQISARKTNPLTAAESSANDQRNSKFKLDYPTPIPPKHICLVRSS